MSKKIQNIAFFLSLLCVVVLSWLVWAINIKNQELNQRIHELNQKLDGVHDELSQQLLTEVDGLKNLNTQLSDEIEGKISLVQDEFKTQSEEMKGEIDKKVPKEQLPFILENYHNEVIGQAVKSVVYIVSGGGHGSGFFINDTGRIITNCHVVRDFKSVHLMTWDERWFQADVIARDSASDLAVLQISEQQIEALTQEGPLPQGAKFANIEEVEVGDRVFAVGAPHGLTRTVNAGQVSNVTRYLQGMPILDRVSGLYNLYIQVDAGVMPGNSGGPSFNIKGEVIGVNTRANPQNEAEGFLLPIDFAIERVTHLLESEHKANTYNTIGFDLNPYLKKLHEVGMRPKVLPEGYLSAIQAGRIFADSPAYKEGFRTGDLILEINGEKVNLQVQGDIVEHRKKIAFGQPGDKLQFKVKHYPKLDRRTGKILEEGKMATITLPILSEQTYKLPMPLITLRCYINSLDEDDVPKGYEGGVRFVDYFNTNDMRFFVKRGMLTTAFLLQKKDIIVAVDAVPVKDPGALVEMLTDLAKERKLPQKLTIFREGQEVVVSPHQQKRFNPFAANQNINQNQKKQSSNKKSKKSKKKKKKSKKSKAGGTSKKKDDPDKKEKPETKQKSAEF